MTFRQTSLFVLTAMCKPIKDVQDVMKHFIAVVNTKNCIGGSIKTNVVHLKYVTILIKNKNTQEKYFTNYNTVCIRKKIVVLTSGGHKSSMIVL